MLHFYIYKCYIFTLQNTVNVNAEPIEILQGSIADEPPNCMIYLSNQSQIDEVTYTNIKKWMDMLKRPYVVYIEQEGEPFITSGIDVIIVVGSELNSNSKTVEIVEYIKMGGNALFVSGIYTDSGSSYFHPIFNIQEQGHLSTVQGMKTEQGFMLSEIDVKDTIFDEYRSLQTVSLGEDCDVLLTDIHDNPLIWLTSYYEGRVGIFNIDMLFDPGMQGFFTSTLSTLEEVMIYPIIGAESVYLDSFLLYYTSNDPVMNELYNLDTDRVYRDIIWPTFARMSASKGTRFSASYNATSYPLNQDGKLDSGFAFLVRQALNQNSEVCIGGDLSLKPKLFADTIKLSHNEVKQIMNKYEIRCFIPSIESDDDVNISQLLDEHDSISVIRTNSIDVMSWDHKNDVLYYPSITQGFKTTVRNDILHSSMLTGLGIVSHQFDMNQLMFPQENSGDFVSMRDDISKVFFDYCGVNWLEQVTLSQAAYRTESFLEMNQNIVYTEDKINVRCSQMMQDQPFILYLKGTIGNTMGCSVKPIAENYYLVTANDVEFQVEYRR